MLEYLEQLRGSQLRARVESEHFEAGHSLMINESRRFYLCLHAKRRLEETQSFLSSFLCDSIK